MTPPLSPERLARLLDEAVRPVTPRPGALDRIRHGVRRRRTVRRAGAVLLTAAVIAGGTATALVLTPGAGPARVASLSPSAPVSSATASSAARAALGTGQTQTASLPSAGRPAAPTVASSAPPSYARPAPSSAAQPTLAPSSAPAPAPTSPPASAPASAPPPASPSASPSPSRPAATVPSVPGSAAWAIDGPGRPAARVTIVPVGNATTTSSFLLVVRTAASGTQTVPFSATPVAGMPPFGPVVVGAADAAKDGHTELFVMVDSGCCTEFWTIFRLVNGHIAQVSLSGAPVRLAVGGSVIENAGFSCAGPYLVTYTYAYQKSAGAGEAFLATRDTYRWAGAALVLVSQRQHTVWGERNPALARYSGVSCGALPQYQFTR